MKIRVKAESVISEDFKTSLSSIYISLYILPTSNLVHLALEQMKFCYVS